MCALIKDSDQPGLQPGPDHFAVRIRKYWAFGYS